eukprot:TRINITY_DN4535_c0_g1_i1.p1 TRINITY_DN4535_c0_g1~~TRINITY_DN4535_c0_g1_i1.p1  ORF type:complete len:367 (+),score=76.72 TRINITY_DN4535_c0_g1_i1:44-1144(+)
MPEALKHVLNGKFVASVAKAVGESYNNLSKQHLVKTILDDTWDDRELKSRVAHVADSLREVLPKDFAESIKILKPVSKQFTGLQGMCFPEFIGRHPDGLENWAVAMDGLESFTKNSSSEFAVRPFILKNKDKMMLQMMKWAESDNVHVRRLASEGCRPRLPWAAGLPELQQDASQVIPILTLLKDDTEETVRRSVANNLNDISKDHPELALQLAKEWKESTSSQHTTWVIKHGLRTLLKSGNPEAMSLFGFADSTDIKITKLAMHPKKIEIGEAGEITFNMKLPDSSDESSAPVRLEYGVYYRKKNGRLSRKVFKLSERRAGVSGKVTKRHTFADLSTRKHYTGEHKVAIIVNGTEKGETTFDLIE